MSGTAGRRYLVLAWLSLVVFVVLVAWANRQPTVFVTTWWVSGSRTPWVFTWTTLVRETPTLVAFAAPGVAAWILGRVAVKAGERRGAVPAWIGLTVLVGVILLSVLAVLPAP